MTEEEKLYYETLFLEYEEKLLRIIKDFNIRFVKIINKNSRPLVADEAISKLTQNLLNIWETDGTSIFIEDRDEKNLFEVKCLKKRESTGEVLDEIYLVFCEVFKKLVEEGAV